MGCLALHFIETGVFNVSRRSQTCSSVGSSFDLWSGFPAASVGEPYASSSSVRENAPIITACFVWVPPLALTPRGRSGTRRAQRRLFHSAGVDVMFHGGERRGRARFTRSGVLARPSASPTAEKPWRCCLSTITLAWERMGQHIHRNSA